MNKKKIIFFSTRDWILERFFYNQINFYLDNNFDVFLLCKITKKNRFNLSKKIKIINVDIHKTNVNPFTLCAEFFIINKLIISIKPNLIINCGMKPILISFPISILVSKIKILNSIIGLGYFFNNNFSILKIFVIFFFRVIFKNQKYDFIVESDYLRKKVSKLFHVLPNKIHVIRGVGIDEDKFKYCVLNSNFHKRINFLTVSRLLKDKGINELFYSIKYLNDKYKKKIKFTIIGNLDEDNPNNIDKEIIKYFKSQKDYITYLESSNNIHNFIKNSHILIHPSYHEGLSVICQEAVCIGRGIIASNIPGCREIVKNGFNGLLIKPKNQNDLLNNILYILDNPESINVFNKNSYTLRDQYLKKILLKI